MKNILIFLVYSLSLPLYADNGIDASNWMQSAPGNLAYKAPPSDLGTRYDMTAQRAADTIYTNLTGKQKVVTAYIVSSPSQWVNCYVDGSVVSGGSQTQWGTTTHIFTVSPNSSYKCTGAITGIALWYEQY